MKGIILAAGLGTRLRPLTDRTPKALLPVEGKPMLQHAIDMLRRAGADGVTVNAYHHAEQIIAYCAEHSGRDGNPRLTVSDERPELLDTGGGIAQALALTECGSGDEPVAIVNADILTDFDIKAMVESHVASGADVTLLVNPERKTRRKLLFDDEMRMTGWKDSESGEVRSPYGPDAEGREAAFGGMHVVSAGVVERMKEFGGEKRPFSIIDFYIAYCDKLKIKGYVAADDYRWTDIGKPDVYNSLPH